MSGLLTPAGVWTQAFCHLGNPAEPPAWHYLAETAAYGAYAGATKDPHVHLGDDRSAGLGTPAVAPEAMTILEEGWAASPGPFAGGGIIVRGRIDGGMEITICHLRSSVVGRGQRVARGQLIGYEGSTGNSTGSHKHICLATVSSYGIRTFRNLAHYLVGGKYASSSLIRPAATATYLVVSGAGVNVRTGPSTTASVYRTSTSTYLIGVRMQFGGWVTGGKYVVGGVTGTAWAKVWLNGGWRYIAKPLVRFV